ncbi:hypothetical protein [Rodentibacter myodis]|uniref:DUF5405 domain-containing protein n=1 Tax=Rodentibacter myodis TaxID=1907939 RepID=A0A1V3JQ03_9PAST|nr:hypothetical protein [Rodentibacter myodis]OOF58906.1 hypothetical protein BKL49_05025 [Rodentibacter myodis]
MQEHIIELSNRYALKLRNGLYVLYQITFNENGTYERTGGKVCKNLLSVIDTLIYCELEKEEAATLTEIAKQLGAIQAEVQRIAEIQQEYAHA